MRLSEQRNGEDYNRKKDLLMTHHKRKRTVTDIKKQYVKDAKRRESIKERNGLTM